MKIGDRVKALSSNRIGRIGEVVDIIKGNALPIAVVFENDFPIVWDFKEEELEVLQ